MLVMFIQGGEHLEFHNRLEVTNKFNPECFERYQEIKIRRKHRFIIFKLGQEEMEGTTHRAMMRFA